MVPMRRTFEVEVREASPGREPRLFGTMIQEGRAASKIREVFTPGSVSWPHDGVGITVGHFAGEVEARAQPIRERDGRISLTARATDAIREAVAGGSRYMSVEFVALKERRTAGGIREVLSAFVPRAALVPNPEYDTTTAEVRAKRPPVLWWL